MRYGLFTSVFLHVALLVWALFTIQAQPELRVSEPDPIVTGLVTEGELTKLRQGVRTAKQLEAEPKESPKAEPSKKEAPKPKPVAAAPPPPPAEPPPPPKDEPKPEPEKLAAVQPPPPPPAPPVPSLEEQRKLEDMLKEQQRQADEMIKAEEQRKAEDQRKLEEQKKAEEQKRLEEEHKRKEAEAKKKREEERRRKLAEAKKKQEEEQKRKEAEAKKQFDAEKIAALLNKVPDKGAPRPSMPLDEQANSLNKGPVLGAPEGRDRQISASEIAIIGQIIKSCVQTKWNVLGGGESAQHTQVKVRLRFNPDGRLAAAPQVVNPQSTPYFMAVQDSALRAVQECEPYPLPPAKYDIWRDIVLNFDPRDMF